MKVGISTWLWVPRFTDEHADLIHKVADIGFDWIEFPLEEVNQFDYEKIGAVIRERGLSVGLTAVLRLDRDLTVDDPARNHAAVAYLRHCVDAVTALGGNCIGGGIYGGVGRIWQSTPEQRQHELERVAHHLRSVGRYAEDRGVVFGVETLIRFRSRFINTVAEALELVAMVDSPAIRVMADTFHMNVEEKDVARAIEQVGDFLVHVHANENDRTAPGSGHMDWPGIRAALRKIGYDGALVIESFGDELKARMGQPLEAQQDMIAREGCKFLREFFAAGS